MEVVARYNLLVVRYLLYGDAKKSLHYMIISITCVWLELDHMLRLLVIHYTKRLAVGVLTLGSSQSSCASVLLEDRLPSRDVHSDLFTSIGYGFILPYDLLKQR